MPSSRVRIDTHIADDQPQTSFVGRGETAWETGQQCPVCGLHTVASNGVMLWCTQCNWSGQAIKHKPLQRKEHVFDEW